MSDGVSGNVQQVANDAVDAVRRLANETFDLGEEAASVVLGAVIEANTLLGSVLNTLRDKLVGK